MHGILGEFFADYVKWVDEGAEDNNTFFRSYGLCSNYASYVAQRLYGHDHVEIFTTANLLGEYFRKNGMGLYPFGGSTLFFKEVLSYTCHLNPDRLSFAREQAVIYSDQPQLP